MYNSGLYNYVATIELIKLNSNPEIIKITTKDIKLGEIIPKEIKSKEIKAK